MVLVFKTSVQTKTEVDDLAPLLNEVVGDRKWNFDLEDCDKVLRVLPDRSDSRTVISLLRNKGYECIEFDD
jgi:hypothetical protein